MEKMEQILYSCLRAGLPDESVQIRETKSILDGLFAFRERKLPMEEKVVEIELERLRSFKNHMLQGEGETCRVFRPLLTFDKGDRESGLLYR